MSLQLENLRENLEEFVYQPDYSVLVLSCSCTENPYTLSQLASFEQVSDDRMIWLQSAPFRSAGQYVGALVDSLHSDLVEAAVIRQREGESPHPEPPSLLKSPGVAPSERLLLLLEYLTRLVPDHDELAIAVGLLPTECADIAGYAELVRSVIPSGVRPRWMQGLRLVVYDDRAQPHIVPALERERSRGALVWGFDLSPEALTTELYVQAADTASMPAKRMNAYLQLAALDDAHGRHAEAQQKYAAVYQYFTEHSEPSMRAVSLHASANGLLLQGDAPAAKARLQSCLGLCVEHGLRPLMLMVLESLSRICFEHGAAADAEQYALSATYLAAGSHNPSATLEFVQRVVDAQLAQGKIDDARVTLAKQAELCWECADYEGGVQALTRKGAVEREAGLSAALGETLGELHKFEQECRAAVEKANEATQ